MSSSRPSRAAALPKRSGVVRHTTELLALRPRQPNTAAGQPAWSYVGVTPTTATTIEPVDAATRRVLSVAEAAELPGVSEWLVLQQSRLGTLRRKRYGRRIVLSRDGSTTAGPCMGFDGCRKRVS